MASKASLGHCDTFTPGHNLNFLKISTTFSLHKEILVFNSLGQGLKNTPPLPPDI